MHHRIFLKRFYFKNLWLSAFTFAVPFMWMVCPGFLSVTQFCTASVFQKNIWSDSVTHAALHMMPLWKLFEGGKEHSLLVNLKRCVTQTSENKINKQQNPWDSKGKSCYQNITFHLIFFPLSAASGAFHPSVNAKDYLHGWMTWQGHVRSCCCFYRKYKVLRS